MGRYKRVGGGFQKERGGGVREEIMTSLTECAGREGLRRRRRTRRRRRAYRRQFIYRRRIDNYGCWR